MNKRIIVEENAITSLPNIFKDFSKILLVTTKDVYGLFSGWIDKLLESENCEIYYLGDYTVKEASMISNKLIINYFDCVVSIGGGVVNDTCKLAAKYSEKVFISIPTIVSNDGVCSNTAVLKFEDNRTDGLPAKAPDIIIIDTNIVKNAPLKYLKAGICDILSNYTALWDWNLAVEKDKETRNDIARIISSNAFYNLFNLNEKIDSNSNEHLKIICESLILSGISMEIKGNTRPCSGAEHLFNHAINTYHTDLKILHGYLVGLGALVSSLWQKQDYKLLVEYLKKNDIDVRPSSLGITREIFIDAWMRASSTRQNRYTVLNEIKLNEDELSKIYDKIEKEAF